MLSRSFFAGLLYILNVASLPLQAEDCYRKSFEGTSEIQPFTYALQVTTGSNLQIVLWDPKWEHTTDIWVQRDAERAVPRLEVRELRPMDFAPSALGPDTVSLGTQVTNLGFAQLTKGKSGKNRGAVEAVYWYDGTFRKTGTTEFPKEIHTRSGLLPDGQLLGVFDWVSVGSRLFGYGSMAIHKQSSVVQMGFFITDLIPPGASFTPMAELVLNFPDGAPYSLLHPYMVADGDWVYFLAMGVYPELYAYNIKSRQLDLLEGFPGTEWKLPGLASNEILPRYQEVERSNMPVGLFANQTGYLYCLYREYHAAADESTWYIRKLLPAPLDRSVKAIGEPFHLPTQREAKHVVLLPGKSTWSFFELSGASEDRATSRRPLALTTIPSQWIEQPAKTSSRSVASAAGRRPSSCSSLQ